MNLSLRHIPPLGAGKTSPTAFGLPPLWVPLVVAALGLLGTIGGAIGGVLVTQAASDQRDIVNWNRQRERERERWAREDAARTFDHRRDSYIDFYESLQEMALRAYRYGVGEGDELLDWQLPGYRRLQHLRVYATPATAHAASEGYNAAWWWGHGIRFGHRDEDFYRHQEEYDQAETVLLACIRDDLGIAGEIPAAGEPNARGLPDDPAHPGRYDMRGA